MSLYPPNDRSAACAGVKPVAQAADSQDFSVRKSTVLMVIVFSALILIGLFPLSPHADEPTRSPVPAAAAPASLLANQYASVDTIDIQRSTTYDRVARFTGRVEAAQTIQMAFELGGTVQFVMVKEGDQVVEGDVLAQLETRSLKADMREQLALRKSNEAVLKRNEIDLARESQLERRGFTADQAVANARLSLTQARASLEQADARILALDIALQKANLKAPFGGVVGQRLIDAGAIVQQGEPIFTLFDNATMTVRVGLPPHLANTLTMDQDYSFSFGDSTFTGQYKGTRPDLSQITRTLEARFEVSEAPAYLAYGQLVTLNLKQAVNEPGYWVPLSALTEAERGLWSVLAVHDVTGANKGGLQTQGSAQAVQQVSRQHVDIIHSDGAMAYVRGNMAESVRVVARGGHRLVPGQRVQIVSASQ